MVGKFGQDRFLWGINIDNMWDFAGAPQPKSTIIPFLLSVTLPRGPIRVAPDLPKQGLTPQTTAESSANTSGENDRATLCKELAAELTNRNIDFVRCWFQWNFFEPSLSNESIPNFQFPLDDFVSALTGSGIQIIAVIGNGYSRFLPAGLSTEDAKSYTDRLVRATREIVRHYKDSVKVWQIENEPNWWAEHYTTHWRSGGMWVEQGTKELILAALRDVVRIEAPNSTIIVNLEADNRKTDWKAYAGYCDVIGLDFYPNYSHSSPVDASELKFCSEVSKQTDLPVFVAETGYPSGPLILGYDEKKQADYVGMAAEESFTCEEIFALCLWRFADTYWRSFPDMENHFGLLTKEGNPKQGWIEYHNQIKARR